MRAGREAHGVPRGLRCCQNICSSAMSWLDLAGRFHCFAKFRVNGTMALQAFVCWSANEWPCDYFVHNVTSNSWLVSSVENEEPSACGVDREPHRDARHVRVCLRGPRR